MNSGTKKAMVFALALLMVQGCSPKKAAASDGVVLDYSSVYEKKKEDVEVYQHIVSKGENLSRISKKYYGETSFWKELALFNNIKDPDVIRVGQIINVPKKLSDLLNYLYIIEEGEVVTRTVQKGDTLYEICKEQYGDTRKSTIWKLATYNKLFNPNYIRTGQVLKLPPYEELLKVDPIDYVILPFPEDECECEHHHHHCRKLIP